MKDTTINTFKSVDKLNSNRKSPSAWIMIGRSFDRLISMSRAFEVTASK